VPVGRNVPNPAVIENVEAGSAAGYATGTVVHADALRAGKNAVVDLDVAFSGAAFAQKPAPAPYENEVHRLVANLDAKRALGRGTGLELGLLADPEPLLGKLSLAEAPVSTDLIKNSVGPIAVPGIVYAELLKSAARARATETGCPLGKEAGYGLGSVLNLEVLGGLLATNARPPYREVAQSSSITRIVKTMVADKAVLGLKSETRQTIAPVTLFKDTPFQFTIEVLGEWALRATAFGDQAAPSLHYGPLDPSPETPVVRILDRNGEPIFQVTTQMLLGDDGLELVIPGVAEIVIGEDPRMIGDNATSDPLVENTKIAAAADVVRVKLLNGQLADVRVGHMEAAVTVPAGGVQCPGLVVEETVEPDTVTTGDEFTYQIDITNPNDCIVTGLKLVATTNLPEGVLVEVVSTTPTGTASGTTTTFNDLGTLDPGETKTIKITSKVPLGSAEGLVTGLAVAEGVCPVEVVPPNDTDGTETGGTPDIGGDIPVRGEDSVDGPTVDTCIVPKVEGLPLVEATKLIIEAGCDVGEVTQDPDAGPGDEGEVTTQTPDEGSSVPRGTDVDLLVGGELCTVPSVIGMSITDAGKLLADARCDLGDTNLPGGDDSGMPGTINVQDIPPGGVVPAGTKVNVGLVDGAGTNLVAASTSCNVPGLVGLTEAEARTKVEQAGCVLVVEPKNTGDPNELGKVIAQNPGADTVVPRGSNVTVDIGVQVLGDTLTAGQEAAATPNLARTGGLFLGGLSLWLLMAGLAARGAGSKRLWRLIRRGNG
jgi:beta-lactam-binding protein with PASTA domain